MRFLPLFAIAAFPWATASAQAADYIRDFRAARALEESDPSTSAEKMIECFHHAAAAGDHEYTCVAGLNACITLYHQGRTVDAGKLAAEVIRALVPLVDPHPQSAAMRRVQLFGYIERGRLAEGKIGAAWQANRAAAETLRGKIIPVNADGPPVTLAEVMALPPTLRSFGFRVIEREANLLDLAGRSNDARALLDTAADQAGGDWQSRFDAVERFYIFKLLCSRAQLLDFLGDQETAIRIQQQLVSVVKPTEQTRQSHLNLRINLLRNQSQWSGPTPELLDEARSIAAEMKSRKIDNGVDRLIAKMEFDLESSRKPLDAITRNALRNRDLGDAFEATYAERDGLLTRAKLGDAGLDGEFQTILKALRSHGNKRGEPSLYRSYGNYLLQQKRPAEAIALFTESLRMTRGFGWVLHEPGILGGLIDARLAAGDEEGARATFMELDRWIALHPNAPAQRRVMAEANRAEALAKLGDEAAARAAFRRARELAEGLPAYQCRGITAEQEELVIREGRPPIIAGTDDEAKAIRVQPLEVVGVAVPGETAHTRFSAFNPTRRHQPGNFIITGPGANISGQTACFTAGAADASVKLPSLLPAGGEQRVPVSLAAGAGVEGAAVTIAWQPAGGVSGLPAKWQVAWNPEAKRSVVIDASRLEANPFRSVSLFHELAVPLGETEGIPFRLRSNVPLRFEYLDPDSGALLAVDANGNGDFTEAGDLHLRGPQGLAAAIFPTTGGRKSVTAEVRIFAPDGLPLAVTGKTLVLTAEVCRNGEWTKEAEDTLE